MQTQIPKDLLANEPGQTADKILRSCVHCGFCLSSCPTYGLLGDELDSPRGRIYLIKSVIEGNDVSHNTLAHLDRCLTCRSCETPSPLGVENGHLLAIGREIDEDKSSSNPVQSLLRDTLRTSLYTPRLFNSVLKAIPFLRPSTAQKYHCAELPRNTKLQNQNQPSPQLPENWEKTFCYSLAMNYQADPKWIYRAGVALDETPVPSAEDMTARIPDNDRIWLSLGFGYKMSDSFGIDVGYSHLFFDDIAINNTDASFGHTLTGSYEVSVDIFSAQFNWNF